MNGDQTGNSPNVTLLETSIGSGAGLLSDSMTIGDLADQKQQRNRTVIIDVAVSSKKFSLISRHIYLHRCFQVDSSSLNDDLVGNNSEIKKKTPTRMASFESKPLLDGKTNGK